MILTLKSLIISDQSLFFLSPSLRNNMPSLTVKVHSLFHKYHLKHQLTTLTLADSSLSDPFGITIRPDDPAAPPNPTFQLGGVATKDIHVDPLSSLSLRIFLPDSALGLGVGSQAPENGGVYSGYSPPVSESRRRCRKLPVMLQFHGGGFVSGSNVSAANDAFCRRMARLCDVIVVAVGYRLAPESRFPAAFEDGVRALNWLGKQANLASLRNVRKRSSGGHGGQVADGFGESMAEPWLAAHGDPSRCVLLGVSSGANIADHVARKAATAGKLLEPVKVVAQVLMYPFFAGSVPTKSEIKLSNSYFYDKAMCSMAWKLFLPVDKEFNLDHPAANPLLLPAKHATPMLTVVAEHDLMRDRAIAYSEELRRANVDAPLLDYKDAVHEFATLGVLLQTPQALACAEDVAIWVKKYISLRGHEFSY